MKTLLITLMILSVSSVANAQIWSIWGTYTDGTEAYEEAYAFYLERHTADPTAGWTPPYQISNFNDLYHAWVAFGTGFNPTDIRHVFLYPKYVSPNENCSKWVPVYDVYECVTRDLLFRKVLWDCGKVEYFGDPGARQDALNGLICVDVENNQELAGMDWELDGFFPEDSPGGGLALALSPDSNQTIEGGEYELAEAQDIEAGKDDTGNANDSERLTDIVNNTAKIANNQQDMADYLKDISSQLRHPNDVNIEVTGTYEGPSAEAIANEIDSNDDERAEAEGIETQAAVDSVLAAIDAAMPTVEDYGDFEDSAIVTLQNEADTEEAGLDALYETAINAGGMADAVANSGVQTSGSVSSICCVIYGEQICFDFSNYVWFLDTIGASFLSLCYMMSLFTVLKGGG